jgi:hypothetical protein
MNETEEKLQQQNLGQMVINLTIQNERRRENQMQRDREEAVRVNQEAIAQAKKEPKVITEYPSMNQAVIVEKPHGGED